MLVNYERLAIEKGNITSSSRCVRIHSKFPSEESLPTPDDEYALQQRLLPGNHPR
jgi:hypothetical protein